jgi:hypothetical protein
VKLKPELGGYHFEVVQASTIEQVLRDSSANATTYRHMARLPYVLRKPLESDGNAQ